MKEEIADFDKFMDDADKEFIDFMRNPWKEFESEKPVVKRVKPEPVEPVVYDETLHREMPSRYALRLRKYWT